VNELSLKEAADLVGGKAIVEQVSDDAADAGLRFEELGRAGLRAAWRGDVGAGAMAELKQTSMLQLHVGFGDGVVADDKLFGERPDAGHQIAVLQDAGLNGMAHLFDELQIKRMSGGRSKSEIHEKDCTTVMVQNVD
jgi:hypothetical protein